MFGRTLKYKTRKVINFKALQGNGGGSEIESLKNNDVIRNEMPESCKTLHNCRQNNCR